jgi:hypothetical protein
VTCGDVRCRLQEPSICAAPSQPTFADQIQTDRVINELMGKDAFTRFGFIMERAEEARELDV